MACVSSESQARGAHVLFQCSVWGEKGDLGRLCLSVLHVLCILSFVMISASAEGGMLASRVQERGGLMGDWGAVQSNFADLGVVPVIPTSPACRHTDKKPPIPEHQSQLLLPQIGYMYTVSHSRYATNTHAAFTILPAMERHASRRSRLTVDTATQKYNSLHHCYLTTSPVCHKTDTVQLLQKQY